MTDPYDALRSLKSILAPTQFHVDEIVHRFQLSRRRPTDDEVQEVDVKLLYSGDPDHPWMVSARDHARNIVVSANPAPDSVTAMKIAHWYQLDGPALPPLPTNDDH